MQRRMRALGEVILRDPDVAGVSATTASTGGNGNAQTANTARFTIVLKPREERTQTASQIINRLRPQLAKVQGANLSMQIGRASCRERVCQYGSIEVVAGSIKKKKQDTKKD